MRNLAGYTLEATKNIVSLCRRMIIQNSGNMHGTANGNVSYLIYVDYTSFEIRYNSCATYISYDWPCSIEFYGDGHCILSYNLKRWFTESFVL
jgi:hypothetical protein